MREAEFLEKFSDGPVTLIGKRGNFRVLFLKYRLYRQQKEFLVLESFLFILVFQIKPPLSLNRHPDQSSLNHCWSSRVTEILLAQRRIAQSDVFLSLFRCLGRNLVMTSHMCGRREREIEAYSILFSSASTFRGRELKISRCSCLVRECERVSVTVTLPLLEQSWGRCQRW